LAASRLPKVSLPVDPSVVAWPELGLIEARPSVLGSIQPYNVAPEKSKIGGALWG
jgi:hypothetical protein